MKKILLFIARGCFSLIFIVAGVDKLINWQGTVNSLVLTLSKWYMHLGETVMTMEMHEFLVERASVILRITTFLEIAGAFIIVIGFKIRIGALILLLFLVPTTLIMHPFWFSVGGEMHSEVFVFLKNLSLIGALLFIFVGPQPQSVKKCL